MTDRTPDITVADAAGPQKSEGRRTKIASNAAGAVGLLALLDVATLNELPASVASAAIYASAIVVGTSQGGYAIGRGLSSLGVLIADAFSERRYLKAEIEEMTAKLREVERVGKRHQQAHREAANDGDQLRRRLAVYEHLHGPLPKQHDPDPA